MNQKINSRLEFPFDLSLEPYTKETLMKKDKEKNQNKNRRASDEPEEQVEAQNQSFGKDDLGDISARKNITDNTEETPSRLDKEAKADDEEEEERPKEYYEYRLAGVVVHDGTAEFGHYYSYINTNREDLKNNTKTNDKNKWLEFNDSTIRSFSTKNIESECFGGDVAESGDDYWSWSKFGKENSKNAYILVYEKVIKDSFKAYRFK